MNLQNTHQGQKQQWYYIHININNAPHIRLQSCLKTEDQLHFLFLTTPIRGAVTASEAATPNPRLWTLF